MPVQKGNDEDALGLDQVGEAVGAHDKLAEASKLGIRYPVTTVGKADEGFRGIHSELRQVGGVGRRVLSDERNGRLQVVDGGVGPDYLASHFPRRFFTCPWLCTRPAAAARMLRSTF